MKTIKYIITFLAGIVLIVACNEGIDPISYVAPGTDATAPVIKVNYPLEGTKIQVPEPVTSIDIKFEATDDIELKSISVVMDGTEITKFSSFRDYRRLLGEYLYDNVTNGTHVLSVTATDLAGKTTTVQVNFEKKPPYVPLYDGEIFYMPFDGDYMEKVSFITAIKVGNPGFAGEALKGLNAYAGATDSYLTFPAEGLKNSEFSATFWCKLNAIPDRAGIIVMSPAGEASFDASRTKGFRFFREAAGTAARFKLNVGSGSAESWFDGGTAADVDPATGKWVHMAFTISGTECAVYINGVVVSQGSFTGVDWTGCESLSIGSGAPNFKDWGHLSDNSFYDELRIFNKALTPLEIQKIIENDLPYQPKYDGEVFYLPFEDNFMELNSNTAATEVGTPDFADGKKGRAYAGATDSYITFPTTDLKNSSFSAVFWTKVNATPDRGGILVMGPEDTGNPGYPAVQNLRTGGFRFFREAAGTAQRFKLNAGNGTAESWFDGGTAADVDPATGNWVHMAFTISGTECVVYINGEVVSQGAFSGIDWTGCDLLSIMSGAPRFTEWGHLSDLSLMDELRIFNKALTQTEVQTIMNAEN
jgi:hypothetical protein